MSTVDPLPDSQNDRLDRLEREHRSLTARLQQLEKQRGSWLGAAVGSILLLVNTGLLLDYLGLLPPAVLRLPLRARTVEADQYLLRGGDGRPWGRIQVSGQNVGLVRFDAAGNPQAEEPLAPAPTQDSGARAPGTNR